MKRSGRDRKGRDDRGFNQGLTVAGRAEAVFVWRRRRDGPSASLKLSPLRPTYIGT